MKTSRSRDHPRVCGEKKAFASDIEMELGSPPRMRGKEQFETGFCSSAGITPAYAGKSETPRRLIAHFRDHPRVCGEKAAELIGKRYGMGSPPRMRGKVKNTWVMKRPSRITPAYAGKSADWYANPENHEDHPRVCGEKSVLLLPQREALGSPPRMRGKEPCSPILAPAIGITPAYAGKSLVR